MSETPARSRPEVPRKLPLVVPQRRQWLDWALMLAGIAGVMIAATLAGLGSGLVAVCGVGVAVLAVLVGLVGVRGDRRRDDSAFVVNQAMRALQVQLILQAVRWSFWGWPGHLVSMRVKVMLSGARLTQLEAGQVTAAIGTAIQGWTTKLHRFNERSGSVEIRIEVPVPESEVDDDVASVARVTEVVADTLGATGEVVETEVNADGQLRSFAVRVTKAGRFTVASNRHKLATAITTRLPGAWRHQFDFEHDLVTFRIKPEIPKLVERPVLPTGGENARRIPTGVDEDGEIHWWEVGGAMAHQLRAGRTRTGKTVATIGDVVEASRRGWQIFILDPKRIEFLGFRGWPNVAVVATTVPQMAAAIVHLDEVMTERYRQIEEEAATEGDFHRILVVIDEYRQLYAMAKAWWSQTKVSGMPSECPIFEQVGGLLRMAAAARIHVVLATQRPDAEFLGGEARDNFSARSSTGRLSPDGSQMMYEDVRAGSTIPRGIQGRGVIVGLDDKPKEVQFFYTPDPRKASSPEELELLDQLRPASVKWPELAIVFDEEQARAACALSTVKTSEAWELVKGAQLVDASTVPPQPVDTVTPILEEPESADYGPAVTVPASEIEIGDLVEVDRWVCAENIVVNQDDTIDLEWRDDQDNTGTVCLPTGDRVRTKKPYRDDVDL